MKLHDFGWWYRLSIFDSDEETSTESWYKTCKFIPPTGDRFDYTIMLFLNSKPIVWFEYWGGKIISSFCEDLLIDGGVKLKNYPTPIFCSSNIDYYDTIFAPDDFEILSDQNSSNSQD